MKAIVLPSVILEILGLIFPLGITQSKMEKTTRLPHATYPYKTNEQSSSKKQIRFKY